MLPLVLVIVPPATCVVMLVDSVAFAVSTPDATATSEIAMPLLTRGRVGEDDRLDDDVVGAVIEPPTEVMIAGELVAVVVMLSAAPSERAGDARAVAVVDDVVDSADRDRVGALHRAVEAGGDRAAGGRGRVDHADPDAEPDRVGRPVDERTFCCVRLFDRQVARDVHGLAARRRWWSRSACRSR